MKQLGLIPVLLLMASLAFAGPTRYVSDDLEITLRSGPTTQHRIVKMLNSGTPLEVLEVSEDQGWARVRTRDGQDGWVLNRYLLNVPAARDRLEKATADLARAQEELKQLRGNLGSESQRLAAAQAQVAELTTTRERLEKQLAAAGRGLTLSEENQNLKKQIVDLQREIELLQNETERLGDRSQRDWFVTGASVVFAGFIAGIVVTRIRWRKRSGWGSL